ncbi:Alanine--tRNA ligase [Camellia lanceoleosa]|uniref:Alanine--tRNA ligase n=1 Tax=Camellia lanceoleosa TaxID=1840588 RepID=A0ACC0FLL7_9ERIC|nr:Alanine--tRNA ligase [Camellia lanceoleosa]
MSLAATAAAELPYTVKLRIWAHDIKSPCDPLDGERCRLTIPHAVLCSTFLSSSQKVTSLNGRVESATIPAAKKADLKAKGIAVMVFSTDETANKALVCAGAPEKGDKCKQLKVLEWLVAALKPLKGKGGGGKGGLAQGQGSDIAHVEDAMEVATSFAVMKLS